MLLGNLEPMVKALAHPAARNLAQEASARLGSVTLRPYL